MTRARKSRGPRAVPVAPDRILDAAQALFAGQGLAGASIRSVATQAGCDPKLIYYHFHSKEALFLAVLERGLRPVLADLRALAEAPEELPTSIRLWRLLRIYHAHLADNAGLRQMVRGEIAGGCEGIRDGIAALVRPVFLVVSGLLEAGIRRGELRPDLPPFFATFFLVRMELEILDLIPLMSQRMAGVPPDLALPLAERHWFETFWRGIARQPEAPMPVLDALPEMQP